MKLLLDHIPRFGPQDLGGRSRALGEAAFEMKEGRVRAFWFYLPGKRIVLTEGAVKDQRKANPAMIVAARQARRDCLDALNPNDLQIVDLGSLP